MLIARGENNQRIFIDNALKGIKYYCPVCDTELIIKDGQIKRKHFAHVAVNSRCDNRNNDMSEWHRQWQYFFPMESREQVVSAYIPGKEFDEGYSEVKLRADVIMHHRVIEFQHSYLSADEFDKRNTVYNDKLGYDIIWVFDASNANFEIIEKTKSNIFVSWKNPLTTLKYHIPQREYDRIIYLDYDNQLYRLCWCIWSDEDNSGDYSRTILSPPISREDFLKICYKPKSSIIELCKDIDFKYAIFRNHEDNSFVKITKEALNHPVKYRGRMYGYIKKSEQSKFGEREEVRNWVSGIWSLIDFY